MRRLLIGLVLLLSLAGCTGVSEPPTKTPGYFIELIYPGHGAFAGEDNIAWYFLESSVAWPIGHSFPPTYQTTYTYFVVNKREPHNTFRFSTNTPLQFN
jgi:hypothetical protein